MERLLKQTILKEDLLMKHVVAFLIKFIMFFAVLYVVQTLIIGNSGSILTLSIIMAVIAYIIGDLLILPSMGNTVATLADFGIAFVGLWALGTFWVSPNYPWLSISLISAVIIAIGEWFFHKYLQWQFIDGPEKKI
jgi:hypothetical protein